ncbi:hypothetical protein BASA61_008742 [Batrachochytrium salamandrivorans]|nr:hypothetical protein BASA61_008742 [Batrachochytrium salamandrivorans]
MQQAARSDADRAIAAATTMGVAVTASPTSVAGYLGNTDPSHTPTSFMFDDKSLDICDTPERRELALLKWLSTLEKDLQSTTIGVLKPRQADLEKLLLKYLGTRVVRPSRPIRELIARSFVLIYHKGDQRSLFDTVAAIQNMLSNKKTDDLAIRISLVYCIGAITESHGAKVMSLFAETATILIKILKSTREIEVPTRYETIKAASRALRGAGRGATDAFIKDFVRFAKAGISDKLPIIRMASAELFTAIYQHTSFLPPTTVLEYESCISSYVKYLEGSTYNSRRAFSTLIATLFEISQIPGHLSKILPKKAAKTEAYSVAEAAASAEMTILTPTEIFSIIGNQFIKATSRESRVGIMEATAAFLNKSGPKFVETHYSIILSSILDIVFNAKVTSVRLELSFVEECGRFLMRDVVGKMLTEKGQARSVCEILSSYITRWPAVLATDVAPSDQSLTFVLYELAALLGDLGPAANDCCEGLVSGLFGLLPHPSPRLKIALAWVFRSLCLALPKNISPILNKLVGLLQKDIGTLTSDRFDVAEKVLGYANFIAAVTSVIPLRPLYAVYEDAATIFGFSTQLLRLVGTSRDHRISACQAQVAWTLIGSLMSLGPNFVKAHLSQLLLIWKNVFPKSQPKDINASRNELEWNLLLVSRESALAALYSFLIYNAKDLATNDVAKRIVVCLNNMLHFLSTIHPTYGLSSDQTHATPGQLRLYERECQLKRRLFQCYRVISPSSVYDTSYTQLVKAAIDTFALDPDRADRFPNVPGVALKDGSVIIESILSSSLMSGYAITVAEDSEAEDRGISRVMIPDTDVQGIEDMIDRRVFTSFENDPHSLYFASNIARTTEKVSSDDGFSEPEVSRRSSVPAAVAVVDAAIELFSLLFPLQNAQAQETFIEYIFKSATFQGGKIMPIRKSAAQTNSLIAVVGVLKYVMVKRGQIASGKVSVAIRDLADPFLRSNVSVLRATASEILGRLARVVGTATFVGPMIQGLVDQVVNNREPESRAGSALALGSIYSFVGGMAASSHLNTIVGILHSLACDPHPLVHTWALHSLWLTVESAGLMYGPFVNSTLTLIATLFMSDSHETSALAANSPGADSNSDVCPAFGRILHALVGVIGPELQMSTGLRDICFCLYEQLKNDDDPFVVVEAIRCIQNFILFSRKHVDIQLLIPFLQTQLSGDYRAQVYMIRKASVTCLYQLTQHDPETVLSATVGNKLEEQLFALLDVETDTMVRAEIKDILLALLRHVTPKNPSRWLDLCKTILSKTTVSDNGMPAASLTLKSSMTQSATGPETIGGEEDEEDTQGDVGGMGGSGTKSGVNPAYTMGTTQSENSGPTGVTPANIVVVLLPRWRTQTFALTCLRTVVSVVLSSDQPEHLDLEKARESRARLAATGKPCDFLVFRLVDLIRMAFNSSTANIDDLCLGGLFLLRDVLERYSCMSDPDFEGHLLLEQYQAQIIAALAPAFNKESSPEIISTACGVCSFFISASRNIPAMTRPLKLLAGLLEQISDESYVNSLPSSNTFVMLKVSVLRAWAELHSKAAELPDLAQAIQPHLELLVRLWMSMLQDYSRLAIDADVSAASVLDTTLGVNLYMSATRQITLPFYQNSWILVIMALTDLIEQKFPAAMKILEHPKYDEKSDSTLPRAFNILFGLCVEAITGITEGYSTLIRQSSAMTVSLQESTQEAERLRTTACLESISKLIRIHVLGGTFLPMPIFFELLAVFDRHANEHDLSCQTTIVNALENIIADYGSTYFAPREDDRTIPVGSNTDISESSVDFVINEKAYRIVRILFNVIAGFIPSLKAESTHAATLSCSSSPESEVLIAKAFGALALLPQCASLAGTDREYIFTTIFTLLTSIIGMPNLACNVTPKLIVYIKPLLEMRHQDVDKESATNYQQKISNCLCTTVFNLLEIATDQIEELETCPSSNETGLAILKNSLLMCVVILTSQPVLSFNLQSQERLTLLLKTMLEGSNLHVASLAVQYSRLLLLLSCRPTTDDADIGVSYLRLLLPIIASNIQRIGPRVAGGLDTERHQILEELMKTLVLLASNATEERQKLATLAVLVPLFLSAMSRMVDPSTAPSFETPAAMTIHMFSTQMLLQFASQHQQQFKTVLQTLTDSFKVKLEWALRCLMMAQSNGYPNASQESSKSTPVRISSSTTATPKIQLKNFASFD